MAAEKFGCRPSRMVGLRDPVLALDFDLAAAARLLELEREAAKAMSKGIEGEATIGQRAKHVSW